MPTQISNGVNLISIIRSGGDTEIALAVTAALGAAGIAAWHHWKQVQEPGHFDTICRECQERAGLTDEQVEHLNRDVPRRLKERMRRFFLLRSNDVPVVCKNLPLHQGEEPYLEVRSSKAKGITLVAKTPF